MEKDSGKWIMYGVDWDDPECIHTVDEAIEYINEIGFLPLFRNDIPGFSLEERTVPEYWWCEDVDGMDMILMRCMRMEKPRISIKRSWIILWKHM